MIYAIYKIIIKISICSNLKIFKFQFKIFIYNKYNKNIIKLPVNKPNLIESILLYNYFHIDT